MARGDSEKVKQVHAPDFEGMKRVFLHDLKAAEEKNAKSRGDMSAAWLKIEKDFHCNKKGAKWAFWLLGQSEESRDDTLRTLYGALKILGIGISADLVDRMGDGEAPTMPTVKSEGLGADSLATTH